jgi:hypothetical protein
MKVPTKGELRDRIEGLEKIVSRLRRERRQLRRQIKELVPETEKVKNASVKEPSKPAQRRGRRRRAGAWKPEAKRKILAEARREKDRPGDTQGVRDGRWPDWQHLAEKHRRAMIVRGD